MRTSTMIMLDKYVGSFMLLVLKPFVFVLGHLLHRDHYLEPRGAMLVLKFLGAGSLFIALPNLLGLRRRYPDKKIYLLTTPGVAPFARVLSIFDEIYMIDNRGAAALVTSAISALVKLQNVDTVIDLEIHSRAATLFAVFLRARNRLAFFIDEPFWKRKIATHLLFFSKNAAVYDYYDQLFDLLDTRPASAEDVREHLMRRLNPPPRRDDSGKHICIGHACSDNAPERQLSPEAWGKVLSDKFLPEEKFTFEILGGRVDEPFGIQVAEAIRAKFPSANIMNSCGVYPPAAVVSILDRADEFWGIDSLLLHIARSLRKPATSFWGPSAPQTRMRNMNDLDKVYYEAIICSPCVHSALVAPCHGNNLCIQRVTGTGNASTQKPRWLIS